MTTLTAKLSDQLIKKHLADGQIRQFRDERLPLFLRVFRCRTKGAWYLRCYKQDKWHKLGTWPQIKSSQLIDQASGLMLRLGIGEAPAFEAFKTVGDLCAWYLERVKTDTGLSIKRKRCVQSSLSKHVIPSIGRVELNQFDKPTLESSLLWPLQQDYCISTVRQHFQIVKRAFGQAKDSGHITNDVMATIKFGDIIKSPILPKPCKIQLKDEGQVVSQVFSQTSQAHVLCQFMLLHGTRIGETRQLRFDYIDSARKTLHLPADITKTKPHTIYLSDRAFELLIAWHKALQQKGYRGAFVFPGASRKGPMNEVDANTAVNAVSKGKYTAHDFRKFFRTRLLELGVDSLVAELLLNHELTALQKTYIQNLGANVGADRQRAALVLWSEHLEQVKVQFASETVPRSYQFTCEA